MRIRLLNRIGYIYTDDKDILKVVVDLVDNFGWAGEFFGERWTFRIQFKLGLVDTHTDLEWMYTGDADIAKVLVDLVYTLC